MYTLIGIGSTQAPFCIYDTCAYPQIKRFGKWGSALNTFAGTLVNDLQEPNTINEKDLCIDAFTGEDLNKVYKGQLSGSNILSIYSKIVRVLDSLREAKKVHIKERNNECMALPSAGNTIYQVCGYC